MTMTVADRVVLPCVPVAVAVYVVVSDGLIFIEPFSGATPIP